MSAEATRSGRAGPEPTPDAGRSHAIDRPVRHAPQPTRRRPRFTPPARKDENPPEAIRHPARNDPPREPRKPDGRLHQSSRHRSAEAITVSSLTPELSRAAKRHRLERVVRQALRPKAHPRGWHDSQLHVLGTHRPAACPMNLPMRPRTPTVHCDSLAEARRTNHKSKSYTPNALCLEFPLA